MSSGSNTETVSDMDDFSWGCDISGDLTEALKAKGVCMNRNMKCTSPIEPVYFRCENSENICAWCSKPLNEDSVKKLKQKLQTHSLVQPNCGEKVVWSETREVLTGGLFYGLKWIASRNRRNQSPRRQSEKYLWEGHPWGRDESKEIEANSSKIPSISLFYWLQWNEQKPLA